MDDDGIEAVVLGIIEKRAQLGALLNVVSVGANALVCVEAFKAVPVPHAVALDLTPLCVKGVPCTCSSVDTRT